jgi:hypothetical protein
MMALFIFVLGYHAAIFSSTQALEFKNKFLPIKPLCNNILLLGEKNKREENIKKIENVLKKPSSFMVVGETNNREEKYYFFLTEHYNGLHRVDAYIINDYDDIFKFKKWHKKYLKNYLLQLF